jgi:hypothetical protein
LTSGIATEASLLIDDLNNYAKKQEFLYARQEVTRRFEADSASVSPTLAPRLVHKIGADSPERRALLWLIFHLARAKIISGKPKKVSEISDTFGLEEPSIKTARRMR